MSELNGGGGEGCRKAVVDYCFTLFFSVSFSPRPATARVPFSPLITRQATDSLPISSWEASLSLTTPVSDNVLPASSSIFIDPKMGMDTQRC